jgi:hypothetical protein
MLNIQQFRDLVIIPTLERMGGKFNSPDAVCLLLGTAIHESRLEYLKQIPNGPALGLYQIEPATIEDIHANYLSFRPELNSKIESLLSHDPNVNGLFEKAIERCSQAVTNMAYQVAMARLVYYRRPEPLPHWENSLEVAKFWKTHFNTIQGAGKVGDFEKSYRELILS